MLMIRLARFGAKKKPTYRVVVIEKERARNSRSVEVVGHYNPVAQPAEVHLEHDRIEYWIKERRATVHTVSRLLKLTPAEHASHRIAAGNKFLRRRATERAWVG